MNGSQEIELIKKFPKQCENFWIDLMLLEIKNGHPITDEEIKEFLKEIEN